MQFFVSIFILNCKKFLLMFPKFKIEFAPDLNDQTCISTGKTKLDISNRL